MTSPGASSVPANSEPIMTLSAPAAIALATSPEYLMPPSAMTGMPRAAAAWAASAIAVSCGTPTPATTRVVQMEPGPTPTLTRVDAGLDERDGAADGGHVAGDQLQLRPLLAGGGDGREHAARVAVRGVDADDVAAGGDQRLDAGLAVRPHADRRADPQPAQAVLDRERVLLGLLDVLDGDEALEPAGPVDHQELLDPVLVQQLSRLRGGHSLGDGDQLAWSSRR